MKNKKIFCLHTILFKNSDPSWMEKYWEDPAYRLTFLLRKEFDNNFWEFYSQNIMARVNNGDLLFRSKWTDYKQGVFISQIWSSLEALNQYKAVLNIDEKLKSSLWKSHRIELEERIQEVDQEQCQRIINEITYQKHIVQFLHKMYFHFSGPIGDPVKSVQTPFQNLKDLKPDKLVFSSLALPPPNQKLIQSLAEVSCKFVESNRQPGASLIDIKSVTESAFYIELTAYLNEWIWDWHPTYEKIELFKIESGYSQLFKGKTSDNSPAGHHFFIPLSQETCTIQLLAKEVTKQAFQADPSPFLLERSISFILFNKNHEPYYLAQIKNNRETFQMIPRLKNEIYRY